MLKNGLWVWVITMEYELINKQGPLLWPQTSRAWGSSGSYCTLAIGLRCYNMWIIIKFADHLILSHYLAVNTTLSIIVKIQFTSFIENSTFLCLQLHLIMLKWWLKNSINIWKGGEIKNNFSNYEISWCFN